MRMAELQGEIQEVESVMNSGKETLMEAMEKLYDETQYLKDLRARLSAMAEAGFDLQEGKHVPTEKVSELANELRRNIQECLVHIGAANASIDSAKRVLGDLEKSREVLKIDEEIAMTEDEIAEDEGMDGPKYPKATA